METEKQLTEAIQHNDRKAMRRFYDRYAGRAMTVALRYMGSTDDARDVLQDAFVKMLTSVTHFEYRGEGSLGAWVMRIVSNTAVTALRQDHRLGLRTDMPDLPDEPDPKPEYVPPEVLTSLIGSLPEGYRTVLNLYVFEQYSHQQIATMLGIQEQTSASQLAKARRLLAKKMNEYIKTHTAI